MHPDRPLRIGDYPMLLFATCAWIVRALGAMPTPNSGSTTFYTLYADPPPPSIVLFVVAFTVFALSAFTLSAFTFPLAYRNVALLWAIFFTIFFFFACARSLAILLGLFRDSGESGKVTEDTRDCGDFRDTALEGGGGDLVGGGDHLLFSLPMRLCTCL